MPGYASEVKVSFANWLDNAQAKLQHHVSCVIALPLTLHISKLSVQAEGPLIPGHLDADSREGDWFIEHNHLRSKPQVSVAFTS